MWLVLVVKADTRSVPIHATGSRCTDSAANTMVSKCLRLPRIDCPDGGLPVPRFENGTLGAALVRVVAWLGQDGNCNLPTLDWFVFAQP